MADPLSSRSRSDDTPLFSLSQILHLMRVEFARAQRYDYPLSVLCISIDRLGHLRDLYGYDSKEAIFDEVARLLHAETRSCDFLGRLADDRLLAVVPHTPADGLRILGERLLSGVRALSFESEGKKIAVTISIGAVTMADAKTLFFDSLIAAAESALARSAEGGGDRLTLGDLGAPAG
jgi:diguanylate cyclase (GGDEF)-like protein